MGLKLSLAEKKYTDLEKKITDADDKHRAR